jgi:hypothetical protein
MVLTVKKNRFELTGLFNEALVSEDSIYFGNGIKDFIVRRSFERSL